jgi:dUTP pyrophosphatase
MLGVAEFHKVSFNQFLQDSKKAGFVSDETDPEIVKVIWESIKLPARATGGSAGYDFYLPYPFSIKPKMAITIPTGIRIDMQPGWFLGLVPRSGLGFKFGMRLINTFGVTDADYFWAENEGHIMARISVENNMCLQEGDRFMQGILIPHGITRSDSTLGLNRTGGFGSTGES